MQHETTKARDHEKTTLLRVFVFSRFRVTRFEPGADTWVRPYVLGM